MPLQKIVRFKDEYYFQCLFSGVLVKKCYSWPEYDMHFRRKKGGSFADCACAVAYLEKMKDDGKINSKKYTEILSAIRRELIPDKPNVELIAAPEMPPDGFDFAYRGEYPYMHQEELYIDIGTALQWRQEDSERRERGKKAKVPFIYQTVKGRAYLLDADQFPMKMDVLVHPCHNGVVLEDQDAPVQRTHNTHVEMLTGLQTVQREALVILSKRPSSLEDDPGDTPREKKRQRCL